MSHFYGQNKKKWALKPMAFEHVTNQFFDTHGLILKHFS